MVGWKKLEEVCTSNRGVRVIKKELSQIGEFPVIQNSLIPMGYYHKSNYNNIPFVITAGAAGEVGFADAPFWAADDCLCLLCNSEVLPKYVYIWLQEKQFRLKSQVRKGAIPRLSRTVVERLNIAIPPLSEQNRIVGILDTFTESIENLKNQITQRRKQYEYYLDQFLDLEDKNDFVVKPLEEIVSSNCTLTYGIVQPGDDIKGGVPVVRPVDFTNLYIKKSGLKCTSLEISKSYKRTILKGNELLFCVRGTTGIMSFATPELKGCNVTRGIVPIFFENDTTKKFIYYQLKSIKLQKIIAEKTNGAALKQINIKDLRQLPLSLPSFSEQSHIVSILDSFEASISNLEAQLSLRQKQYEYYRNKLLTFE